MLAVFFLSAGSLAWWEAWVYAIVTMVILIGSRLLMMVKDPEMIEERIEANQQENVKSWDKVLVPLTGGFIPMIAWIVAGLDYRFGLSPEMPFGFQIIALVIYVIANLFGTWAMLANRFFSSHVRVQSDRGHTVIKRGPYRIMRHPGYTSLNLAWLATPILFSSYWMGIPALLNIIATTLRTVLEDRTLQQELPGYKEYTQSVRYRLIPGIW
jgi:protein-S-isoprenylcysteine O-methyltransferase Ste14